MKTCSDTFVELRLREKAMYFSQTCIGALHVDATLLVDELKNRNLVVSQAGVDGGRGRFVYDEQLMNSVVAPEPLVTWGCEDVGFLADVWCLEHYISLGLHGPERAKLLRQRGLEHLVNGWCTAALAAVHGDDIASPIIESKVWTEACYDTEPASIYLAVCVHILGLPGGSEHHAPFIEKLDELAASHIKEIHDEYILQLESESSSLHSLSKTGKREKLKQMQDQEALDALANCSYIQFGYTNPRNLQAGKNSGTKRW